MDKEAKEGDLKVWWIPQIPGNPFHVPVVDLEQAKLVHDILARYDLFQYENSVKPDYANAGGLLVFENGEWLDWLSEDGDDFDDWLSEQE